jgi:hypothetical protein
MPLDPFVVIMRVDKRNDDGTVSVTLIPDDVTVHLTEGDEFLTAQFRVDPFRKADDS